MHRTKPPALENLIHPPLKMDFFVRVPIYDVGTHPYAGGRLVEVVAAETGISLIKIDEEENVINTEGVDSDGF
jgi:hypothetical protein